MGIQLRGLSALRERFDLTQAQLATKMGCTQSRVSKMERAELDDLRLGDIKDYLKALNIALELTWTCSASVPLQR